MNNKACKGLIMTKVAIETAMEASMNDKDDSSAVDPEKLIVSDVDSTWDKVDEANPNLEDPTDEASAVAVCRAWYDANAYGKPFCCQITSVDMTSADEGKDFDAAVVNAKKTMNAEPFDMEVADGVSFKFEFGALTFKGAQALASGIGFLASTIVFMN